MRSFLIGTCLFLSMASLPAQHAKTLPEIYTGSYGGGGNLFPFSRTRGFIQYYHRGDQFPSTRVVKDLGFRLQRTITSMAALSHRLEIKVGNTKTTFKTLSKTYAQNFTAKPTVFLALKTINFPLNNSIPADPDKPFYWIKGDVPFIWFGPNLIIQVDIQTSATFGGTTVNANADSMPTSTLVVRNTTKSCGGAIVASYAGSAFGGKLTGSKANGPVIYLIGAHLLPTDVGFILPGKNCSITVNPLLTFLGTADASGAASFSIPFVPAATMTLHLQALHIPLSGPGLASTDVSHIQFGGNNDTSTYLYNWTQNGLISQYGPYTTNRGPIILMR
jgi:hypothetical protein